MENQTYQSKKPHILKLVFGCILLYLALLLFVSGENGGLIFLGVLCLGGGILLLILAIKGIRSVGEYNQEVRKNIEKNTPKVKDSPSQKIKPVQPLKADIAETGINGTQDMLYELDGGVTNILRIFEDRCVLVAKTTARSFVAGSFFNGTKEFFYDDLTSVQFREATKTFNGYIQFNFPGAVNISTSTFGGSGNNYNSENSFIFGTSLDAESSHSHEEKINTSNNIARNACEFIRNKIKSAKQSQNTPNVVMLNSANVSAADELKKFKELLDMGAITQEDYDKKKAELLG